MMKGWLTTLRCVAIVCVLVACAPMITPGSPRPIPGGVRFTYVAPSAATVSVVGSFNGWNKNATPMMRMGNAGVWVATVPLRAGEHAFMYLVDGKEWVVPPLAEDFVTDGFGQMNGVVVVQP